MSTRSTIWMREQTENLSSLHLYFELLEETDRIHLEVEFGEFAAIVQLPDELVDALKKVIR